MAVWKTTAHDVNSQILVEFRGCQGQILKMLDHLVSWERDALLEISVSEALLTIFKLCVGPGEDRGDEDKDLLLGVHFVDRLSQDLDNLLSFFKISATQQVDDNLIAPQYTLSECLWLLLDVKHGDGRAGDWDCAFILLNECTHEFVRLLCLVDDKVIVTHLLEETMSDETVDSGDEDTFVLIPVLLHLYDFCLCNVLIETRFSSVDFSLVNS